MGDSLKIAPSVRVAYNDLKQSCAKILLAMGLPESDAMIAAAALVDTEARGITSHGVATLLGYVVNIKEGGINPRPNVDTIVDNAAVSLMDGDAGMGHVIANHAMNRAIEKAQKYGIGAVAVRNSNHFGAACIPAMVALEHDMIGLVFTNSTRMMGIPGVATGRLVGNNPLAVAIPSTAEFPFVLDMALSVTSASRVGQMGRKGEMLPEGWVVDQHGNNTRDSSDYFNNGALVPAGGHKGFALALVMEILSGLLSGGAILSEVKSWRREPDTPSGTSHMFKAYNIGFFQPIEKFKLRMADLFAYVKGPNQGGSDIVIPGEISTKKFDHSLRTGIELPVGLYKKLVYLMDDLEIQQSPLKVLSENS